MYRSPPVKSAEVVGAALFEKAVLCAARAPPVGLSDVTAAVGVWKVFPQQWAENPLVWWSWGEYWSYLVAMSPGGRSGQVPSVSEVMVP